MDPTLPTSPTNKNSNTLDTENETPPPPPNKPLLQFTNGALKIRKHYYHHHLNLHQQPINASVAANGYKECLRNHAAAFGRHAVDGCGEFMPSPTFNPTDPTSFDCAACGCHRNFHRRDDDNSPGNLFSGTHLRYPVLLPPPPRRHRSSPFSSPSPPPHPSHYGSAPNMLLALSSAVAEDHPGLTPVTPRAANGRKRFRTRFSQEQKEKMHSLSEKLGWKMQRSDEGMVEDLCNEIGVGKGVLKVWMHNNKNTFVRKEINHKVHDFDSNGLNNSNNPKSTSDINGHEEDHHHHHHQVSSSGSPSSAS